MRRRVSIRRRRLPSYWQGRRPAAIASLRTPRGRLRATENGDERPSPGNVLVPVLGRRAGLDDSLVDRDDVADPPRTHEDAGALEALRGKRRRPAARDGRAAREGKPRGGAEVDENPARGSAAQLHGH